MGEETLKLDLIEHNELIGSFRVEAHSVCINCIVVTCKTAKLLNRFIKYSYSHHRRSFNFLGKRKQKAFEASRLREHEYVKCV